MHPNILKYVLYKKRSQNRIFSKIRFSLSLLLPAPNNIDPNSSSPIKLPHQTAVSSDQQKKRPQRNSARKASIHIFSQEGDSDIEKDKSCSEESFHFSDEDLYSSSDASNTQDLGQVLLLTSKTIDFPLPPMKPLP